MTTRDLLAVLLKRARMRFSGAIRYPRLRKSFIGSRVTFRGARHLRSGVGVTIGDNAHIDAVSIRGVEFGDYVTVGENTRITGGGNLRDLPVGMMVGDRVGLGTDNFYGYAGGITIGDDTIIGNFVSLHAENHKYDDLNVPIRLQGTTRRGISIGANCWIGAKVTILDGSTIGDGCIVAAGSVVAGKALAPYGIYGGVPARLLSSRINSTKSGIPHE